MIFFLLRPLYIAPYIWYRYIAVCILFENYITLNIHILFITVNVHEKNLLYHKK